MDYCEICGYRVNDGETIHHECVEKNNWYDKDNNIVVETLPELMKAANYAIFGDEMINLTSWLMCEAFDARFDPKINRALRLAAMIISRVECEAEIE